VAIDENKGWRLIRIREELSVNRRRLGGGGVIGGERTGGGIGGSFARGLGGNEKA